MKIYYEILKNKDNNYYVMKTVENHGIACKRIFKGLKSECIKYCMDRNIQVKYENR